jgi:GNAT superfamily N-acetyltransferase
MTTVTATPTHAVRLRDGATLAVRPIVEDDAERLCRMFDRLSPLTVYRRFFSPIPRPRCSVLRHLATVDHERREALVALEGDEIVAVARYDAPAGGTRAEIAVTVEDEWQHRGLGSELLGLLATTALERGIDAFVASMLAENRPAIQFLQHFVPGVPMRLESGTYETTIDLRRRR